MHYVFMYQVFITAELLKLGLSDRDVRAAIGCCLERVARGRYAVVRRCDDPRHARIWEALANRDADALTRTGDFRDVAERAKVLIRARADLLNRRSALAANGRAKRAAPLEVFSHLSAALLWEFVVVRMPDPAVEIVRSNASARHAHLRIRRRELPDDHVERLGDTVVTTKERTLIDVARDYPLDISVPMLDDALRRRLVTHDDLLAAAHACPEVRNGARIGTVLGLADPRRESPGESIVAVRFHEIGLTGFEPQVELVDDRGLLIARVDFLHAASKTIVEFDGRMKYTLEGRDHREAFDRERERERRLRALGYHVVRVFWKDLWRRWAFTEIERLVGARLPRIPAR